MSDQRLFNDPGQAPVTHGTSGTTRLPVRSPYFEIPSVLPDDPGTGVLFEYWWMLRRRKGTLLLIAFGGLLAGILLTLPQTPVYQARTVLEIQNLNENFLNIRDVSPTAQETGLNPVETDLQTEIGILQSESVIKQVTAKLDLAKRLPALQEKSRLAAWRKALHLPEPQALTEDELLRKVAAGLKIRPQPNTTLVEVFYNSPDPALAADIANTFTAEFARLNLESHWQTAQQTGDWLKQQMEGVRINLEQSEEQLQAYARQAGLLLTDETDNVANEKLRQLQQELSKAQADRVTQQSRQELVGTASPDSLPEVLDDPTLKDYQVKLTDLRRQLAEVSSTLTPIHPSVKKVQAQVATLEAALEKERANVTRRIQNEFESAQRRERLLAVSYDVQASVVTEQAARMAHYNILKRELDNNRQLYDSMLQHVKEAGIASALHSSNVRVVDPARPPDKTYKPSLLLYAILGFFGGGFFGIALVVLRARADRSIQAPGETSRYLDLPELGVIPSARAERSRSFDYYRQARVAPAMDTENGTLSGKRWGFRWRGRRPVELVTSQRKPSVLAESFRSTLASILYSGENGDRPRVIAITSANPREGKTTVASNLAQALAEIGRRVLLIDADLRMPRMHEIFHVPNDWGLSDLLAGTPTPTAGMVVETGCSNLYVLPAGSAAASISTLLHSPRMLELLKSMRQEFDMVIIDTPPMLQIPDARVLGRLADAVILVVRSARTTREEAAAAGRRLTEDGTRVLGTVLSEWDVREPRQPQYELAHRHY